jgi:transposase
MANYLKMAKRSAIQTLRERNWSCRRISRELGIHLDTVRKYAKSDNQNSKQVTNAPPGSVGQISTGPVSNCEPYREIIKNKLDMGLSRQRIWQDLRDDHSSDVSYHSVRRFVNRLSKNSPVPFRRLECRPGEEAQIDFGTGAPVITKEGRRKRTHFIRIVLGFSRKSYSEAVFSQTTDNFINCLENAFRHFGGVPQTLIIDNLKAAVNKADWYDPEIHPKIESFCRHYGTVIMPCKPYTPRHKDYTS